ncbi:MAG: anaerobic ribonucleoside-triphosphate reductase, partial [Promethearchaeota archaeon]
MEFLPKILPKVYRSEGDMVDFDPSKIFESIVRETGMNEKNANRITELATRRIISSGIKFLSGPHIREIVCSILSEQHFEKERKYYTRIGMPLMDYEEILEHPPKKLEAFPESVHQIAANQLSVEYTYLRILSEEESKAHLYGDIYIHGLENFDLKPTSQYWDPRLILRNGLPPLKNYRNGCKYAPASTIEEAILHLTKWLAMTSHEFNGIQGYLFLNNFLAPYIKRLDDGHVKKAMKLLKNELNQLNLTAGRRLPFTFISTYPGIVSSLEKLPAIGPKGEEKGILGDFSEESLKLYNIVVDLFKMGCIEKRPLITPRHFIYFDDNIIKQEIDNNFFQATWEESQGPNIP